mgnify:CR=1 FL=1
MNLSEILSSSNASLRFPLDKVETADDYMMFTVYKYSPPFRKAKCLGDNSGNSYGGNYSEYDITGLGGGEFDSSQYKKIVLYMPEDISQSDSRTWREASIGPLQMAALRAAGSMIGGAGSGQFWTGVDNATNEVLSDTSILPALLRGVGTNTAAKALNMESDQISGGLIGQVVNPNLEVFFSKVGLRTFQFRWILVPRNERESRIIKEMVWQFKKASAPELAQGGWFTTVPHVFKIQYKTGSQDNHWLNKMKACALTNINVNYTAAGSYSTLEDGAPTAVGLQMNFQELKAIISEDYGDSFNYTEQYY